MSEGVTSTSPVERAVLALSAPVCATLLVDLPRARGLEVAMGIADAARRTLIGPGLMTVNLRRGPLPAEDIEDAALTLQRIWTSDPGAYPVAGLKRKTLTPWTRQLLLHGELFIGEGRQALEAVFDDHSLISSLSLQAVINVPVFDGHGECIATFNVLGTQPQWAPEAVFTARLLAALCTPAILLAAKLYAAGCTSR